jgi:cobalt-precorrin-5B (C1)-methyltransferase
LLVPVRDGGLGSGESAWAEVVKDGGDDPDVTNGARIRARVAKVPFPACGSARGKPVSAPICGATVTLYGGKGIGLVTLSGLPVPPGEPAINPQPRRQIAWAAREAAEAAGYAGPLHVLLEIPDGEERGRRTMNARLGIVGGLSVLGTQGTVRPFSHEAWKATIDQGISVAAALGLPRILFSTGRRSERLGFGLYPELPPRAGVQAGDYAAHAVRSAARCGFDSILWVCFPGKLLKLAQRLEWTHAESAATDIALLGRLCAEAGGEAAMIRNVAALPTATGAFSLMAEAPPVHAAVLRRLAGKAFAVLRGWLDEARPGPDSPDLRLHVFSLEGELLLVLPEKDEAVRKR